MPQKARPDEGKALEPTIIAEQHRKTKTSTNARPTKEPVPSTDSTSHDKAAEPTIIAEQERHPAKRD
ncbi:hypothetical protein G7048_02430 [Diaphorobacter sp. HDW4B]|uniref:hypothetical protein n=1 Tax=Diaphorobacter sp. HDW4B TaxID=2714925 RepID=UPI00140DCC8C|nr:hypothetical protein [Diaphorobacter sp. HDW4B]QIL69335.1 hypothetical protein G7048_02430 [Diaphorobacter sp. HDW4B]